MADQEAQSKTKGSNDKALSKEEVEKLFKIENEKEEKTEIEKLPKILLAYLLGFLEMKDLCKMWSLNKFFLNLLSESNCSKMIWKSMCEKFFGELNEEEVIIFVGGINKTEYEKKLNLFCLFFKHNFLPKWDKNKSGKRIEVSPDGASLYIRNQI
jgi:hypothetical protein